MGIKKKERRKKGKRKRIGAPIVIASPIRGVAIHGNMGTSASGGGLGKLNKICNKPLRLDHGVRQE